MPVYNGLTDQTHPTQILADFMTMREFTHKHLSDMVLTFTGEGRDNVARSLAIGAAKVGMDFRFVAGIRAMAAPTGGRFTLTEDPVAAVKGADFIYTDVWLSMGEASSAWGERIRLLTPYRVDAALMAASGNPYVKFMHCLPAFHNAETEVGAQVLKDYGIDCMEVTEEVFESPASIVFDEAENRMHAIKALLVATIGG